MGYVSECLILLLGDDQQDMENIMICLHPIHVHYHTAVCNEK